MRTDADSRSKPLGASPSIEGNFVVHRELAPFISPDAGKRLSDVSWLPRPIDLLTSKRNGARNTKSIHPHNWELPNTYDDLVGFWLPATNRRSPAYAFVCPPELATMQLTRGLNRANVADLINQLSGTYRTIRPTALPLYRGISNVHIELYPKDSTDGNCQSATVYGLHALTNVSLIKSFIDSYKSAGRRQGSYGAELVRQALPLSCDGLASPFESQIWMLAFCSRRQGSLGLPRPEVNSPLRLTDEAGRFVDGERIIPDFYWLEHRVALEANGRLYHGKASDITDTSLRDKAYRAMDIACVTLTPAEVRDERRFQAAMEEVARLIGHRLPAETAAFQKQRTRLRSELFGEVKDAAIEDDPGYWSELARYIECQS